MAERPHSVGAAKRPRSAHSPSGGAAAGSGVENGDTSKPKKHSDSKGRKRQKTEKMPMIIRFEMPFPVWCDGCGSHIARGVRYNAQKKNVGMYLSTKIWAFRMKCHRCPTWFEVRTDPQNTDFACIQGLRKKVTEFTSDMNVTIPLTSAEQREQLDSNALFKLEHVENDLQRARSAAQQLRQLQDLNERRVDLLTAARTKFRNEKKSIAASKAAMETEMRARNLLIPLLPAEPRDADVASQVQFRPAKNSFVLSVQQKRLAIKSSSIFGQSCDAQVNAKRAVQRSAATKHLLMAQKLPFKSTAAAPSVPAHHIIPPCPVKISPGT
eukprot:gnl/Spiro4/11302_TR5961_c0_g1_i1.p1 gnl/Spiro4/11302_TR5961_c0_g1~~gnl/Spiro4/11302_TR5961_c0_g1_i1.p1  ORF type:complete len:325 (+),score=91.43 gnl/Spiro4/11302_TR5961_c0_g1_i1:101-1075(+)